MIADSRTLRRNLRLGIANGILFTFGEALNNGNLVLGLLVRQLGGALWLVGLLPALQSGGWLIPQMLVGGRLQAYRLKLPLYRRSALVRIAAYAVLGGVIFGAGLLSTNVALLCILICYTIYNVGGGTSALAFQDVVAKVVPPQRRGSFFGVRQLYGGLLAFAVAGPLTSWLLSTNAPLPFPFNFGLLSVLSLLFIAAGLLAFCFVIEPPQSQVGPRRRFWDDLQATPALLRRDARYRTFIIARVLTRAGQLGEPFYIIYARELLGVPSSAAGVYLAVRAISAALSNIYWGRVSDRQGNRRLMLLTGIFTVLTPALALLGPRVVSISGGGLTAVMIVMGLVYLCIGLAVDGASIASLTYLMEIAPEAERPSYIGLANTLLGLITLLPVFGGRLVALVGYTGLFAVGLLLSLAGLLVVTWLPERAQSEFAPAATTPKAGD